MQDKILLVNDHLFPTNSLEQDLRFTYKFDVTLLDIDPKDIINTAMSDNYKALIIDCIMPPTGYFSEKQIAASQKKYWSLSSEVPFIGFCIYDEIRNQEDYNQPNARIVKRIPIIFHTCRDIDDLFSAGALEKQNTFFIKKPELTKIVAKKLKEILSNRW